MSALRKLRQARLTAQQQQQQQQQQREATSAGDVDGALDDDLEPGDSDVKAAPVNVFSLLENDVEDAKEDEGQQTDEHSTEGRHDDADSDAALPTRREAAASSRHGGSGSGSKKGGDSTAAQSRSAAAAQAKSKRKDERKQSAAGRAAAAVEDDDLDAVLRSLDGPAEEEKRRSERAGPGQAEGASSPASVADAVDWSFLSTQQRSLDATTEVSGRLTLRVQQNAGTPLTDAVPVSRGPVHAAVRRSASASAPLLCAVEERLTATRKRARAARG